MQENLHGKIALVAGATRGCGRAIAVELGRTGATVYVTGRSTRAQRSEMDRPETIEDTAELVTAAGGEGIAVRVDHLVPDEVRALVARVDAAHGRLDILVNEQSLDGGLRMLELGLHTHIITSHAALPLLVRNPGGLVVEVTDGTDEFNRKYRDSFFYDLTKTSVSRIALAQSAELKPYGGTAVVVTPGFLRSEAMLDHFGVTEQNWRDGAAKEPHFILSETPAYLGRGVAALAADPDRARWTGGSLSSTSLARAYGLTDVDGSVPDIWSYFAEHGTAENGPIDPAGYR
jgi:NAD(P)-dependent dehydrogenase (short-subunit alcohol dehydrogenase family)